jgi:hypothetical protein
MAGPNDYDMLKDKMRRAAQDEQAARFRPTMMADIARPPPAPAATPPLTEEELKLEREIEEIKKTLPPETLAPGLLAPAPPPRKVEDPKNPSLYRYWTQLKTSTAPTLTEYEKQYGKLPENSDLRKLYLDNGLP